MPIDTSANIIACLFTEITGILTFIIADTFIIDDVNSAMTKDTAIIVHPTFMTLAERHVALRVALSMIRAVVLTYCKVTTILVPKCVTFTFPNFTDVVFTGPMSGASQTWIWARRTWAARFLAEITPPTCLTTVTGTVLTARPMIRTFSSTFQVVFIIAWITFTVFFVVGI